MPELPEVECLSRAVDKVLRGKTISRAQFYRKDLRGLIPIADFRRRMVGHPVLGVRRRSKYMLWDTQEGIGIIHLGMTGHVIHRPDGNPEFPHTHAVFFLEDEDGCDAGALHYVDPRRFGYISCCSHEEYNGHVFFRHLGPEPLGKGNLGSHLYRLSRGKSVAIKNFLMNAEVVVGVGNIYANEALFRAGLAPHLSAGEVSRDDYRRLATSIKATLKEAIKAGGTTFRDFRNVDGKPGYFSIRLKVYGRGGEPCFTCGKPITATRIGQRSTYFCDYCQVG